MIARFSPPPGLSGDGRSRWPHEDEAGLRGQSRAGRSALYPGPAGGQRTQAGQIEGGAEEIPGMTSTYCERSRKQ